MSTTTLLYGIFIYAGELYITKWCYITEARSAVPRGFMDWRVMVRITATRRPTRPSAPYSSTTNDSPARPRDRFTRPHRLTTRRTIFSSAPAYNATADLSVWSYGRFTLRGRLACPPGLPCLRLARPSAPAYSAAADSSVARANQVISFFCILPVC